MRNNYTPLKPDFFREKKQTHFIGFVDKEKEPPLRKERKEITIEEKVELEPTKEVAPYLKARKETIKLSPDLKKIGVQAVSTPQFSQSQSIKLPLSDEKIIVGLRAPVTSSLRWLATLALYLLQIAHLQLKVVHGKIVRVFRK